ncbi:MAG: hypothetical protein ACRELC_00890, partial [Gemmatimonadota bacterium]
CELPARCHAASRDTYNLENYATYSTPWRGVPCGSLRCLGRSCHGPLGSARRVRGVRDRGERRALHGGGDRRGGDPSTRGAARKRRRGGRERRAPRRNGGFNTRWSWHLDPATVHAPDAAIGLCDGRPSLVEADLDYWIETVGQFCPWGARVVARTQ